MNNVDVPFFEQVLVLCSIAFTIGFLLFLVLGLVIVILRRMEAKSQAAQILADAADFAREAEESVKMRVEEFKNQLHEKHDGEIAKLEDRIEELEDRTKAHELKLEQSLETKESIHKEMQSETDQFENQVRHRENKIKQRRETIAKLTADLVHRLTAKAEENLDQVKDLLKIKLLEDRKIEVSKQMQLFEEDSQNNVEAEAKKLLTLTINRFARPYCPERGIGYLNFESEQQKATVLGPEMKNLRTVEKLCGIDLAYDEKNNAVNVYGFDPVRRELGRGTVDRMMKERSLDDSKIEKLYEDTKKALYQRIVNDGNRIFNELKLQNAHPEIKHMMGALRYRYSFTQNQHFHCAEVGHLAGLMAAELNVSTKDARRAGLLHDIGKAMDHSVDGGHAVIGADFIAQRNEEPHIVHAVRAHHFDEQPSTDLAYIVIAADAISGARPGARRSTAANYTQKIQDLQSIARGFDGVIDTHVLSAGREIRVYVDGSRMDDMASLGLSREIAHKIEDEMQYPGQIRVTVVRQTYAVEMAR